MCNSCKKNTIITEEERLNILRQYSLIQEQEQNNLFEQATGNAPKGFTADANGRFVSPFITNLYGPGWYTLNDHEWRGKTYSNKSKLDPYIQAAKEYLKTNKGLIPRIYIDAGESIIPNWDNEGKLTGGSLKEEELSNARAKNIQSYFTKQIQDLIDGKFISRKPDEVKVTTIIGKTQKTEPSGGWPDYQKWVKAGADPAVNPEYAKLKAGYDADQFTKIRFIIEPDLGENQCLFNLKININYDIDAGHNCNAALFEVTANGIRITTQAGGDCNMNNAGGRNTLDPIGFKDNTKVGGFRYNTLILKDKATVDKIIAASGDKKEISIRLRCLTPAGEDRGWGAGKCHTDVPHVSVYDSDNRAIVKPFFPNVAEGEICVLDKCGKLLRGAGGQATAGQGDKTNATITLNIPDAFTGTSQEYVNKLVSAGSIKLNADNKTYQVLKNMTSGADGKTAVTKGSNIKFNQRAAKTTTTTAKVTVPTGTTPKVVKLVSPDDATKYIQAFINSGNLSVTTTASVYKVNKDTQYNKITYKPGEFIKVS